MLICGVEEPIQINEQLYSLNEETGKIDTSRAANKVLNRYSFVWTGDRHIGMEKFTDITRFFHKQLDVPAAWLFVWLVGQAAGVHATRSRMLLSKRQKEGWIVHSDHDLAVALASVDGATMTWSKAWDWDWIDGGLLLSYGNIPAPEVFTANPLRPSIELFAKWKKMAPSSPFLFWLAEQRMSIAYCMKAENGNPGLVVVGSYRLNMNDLLVRGIVDEMRVADEATQAWR